MSNAMMKVFYAAVVVSFMSSAYGLSTEDIQKSIDETSRRGGGRVVIPAGEHVTGLLMLKSNVEIYLSKGARLSASGNLDFFKAPINPGRLEGAPCAVITAIGVTNVAVRGEGEIFGNAWAFDYDKCSRQKPMGLCFYNCKDVKLEDFSLRDSAAWGINLIYTENVIIRRLKINNHAGHCTDGIDIEGKNVLIEDCVVDTSDDSYCIKSNNPDYKVENIVVRNCIARSHCNAFKLGTASHGVMRNISFVHCRAEPAGRVYRDLAPMPKDLLNWKPVPGAPWYLCGPGFGAINVECVDGGLVENIVADDIEISGFQCPIFIRGGDRDRRSIAPQGKHFTIRNVVISNIRGRADGRMTSTITGVNKCRPFNILLKNIDIEIPGEGVNDKPYSWPGEERADAYPQPTLFDSYHLPAYGLFIDKADAVVLDNVKFSLKKGTSDKRSSIFEVK